MSDHAAIEQADQDRQGVLALLTAHKRRLRALEEQRALRGLSAPPEIGFEIEDIGARIAALNEELAQLEARE